MRVEIKGLTKSYGKNVAVSDISLTIENGMYGLLGPNGAGKTTLMRMLTTLLTPDLGTALVGGYDIRTQKREVRQLLGYLPQDFGLYKKLTAFEFVELVAGLKGYSSAIKRREETERVLRQVNLWERRNDRLGGFSGGMRRRVGIAQALLGSPQLLIVDEPTAGLDPEERIRFRNLLSELSKEKVVILSTHIVGDIESTCSGVAIMRAGQLLFNGSQAELIQQAEDRTWNVEIPDGDLPRLKSCGKVVATRRNGPNIIARVVSVTNPLNLGTLTAPTLEDGYMALADSEQASD